MFINCLLSLLSTLQLFISELYLRNMLPPRIDRRGRVNANYTRIRNNQAVLGNFAVTVADDVEPLDARNLAVFIFDLVYTKNYRLTVHSHSS